MSEKDSCPPPARSSARQGENLRLDYKKLHSEGKKVGKETARMTTQHTPVRPPTVPAEVETNEEDVVPPEEVDGARGGDNATGTSRETATRRKVFSKDGQTPSNRSAFSQGEYIPTAAEASATYTRLRDKLSNSHLDGHITVTFLREEADNAKSTYKAVKKHFIEYKKLALEKIDMINDATATAATRQRASPAAPATIPLSSYEKNIVKEADEQLTALATELETLRSENKITTDSETADITYMKDVIRPVAEKKLAEMKTMREKLSREQCYRQLTSVLADDISKLDKTVNTAKKELEEWLVKLREAAKREELHV